MARPIRKSEMKEVPLSEIKSEDDWFEYRLEHDPRFLRRIEQARSSLSAGLGSELEDIEQE